MPTHFEVSAFSVLLDILGAKAKREAQRWEGIIAPALRVYPELRDVLVKQIPYRPEFSNEDMAKIVSVVKQLKRGAGQGLYTRSLPLKGVDTKFLETHEILLAQILDVLHDNEITEDGGLRTWLGCKKVPTGWLTLRAACPEVRKQLGGHELLQLDQETVSSLPITPSHLLIVENLAPIFVPAPQPGMIIVGPCGRNLAWLRDCEWASTARVGYWGDIDSWGFSCLGDARSHQAHLESLMMDQETFERFIKLAVKEPSSSRVKTERLSNLERDFCTQLIDNSWDVDRLEQERVSGEYAQEQLRRCIGDNKLKT